MNLVQSQTMQEKSKAKGELVYLFTASEENSQAERRTVKNVLRRSKFPQLSSGVLHLE